MKNRVVFWENLHSWQKFCTTAGLDSRDKSQLWRRENNKPEYFCSFTSMFQFLHLEHASTFFSRLVWSQCLVWWWAWQKVALPCIALLSGSRHPFLQILCPVCSAAFFTLLLSRHSCQWQNLSRCVIRCSRHPLTQPQALCDTTTAAHLNVWLLLLYLMVPALYNSKAVVIWF